MCVVVMMCIACTVLWRYFENVIVIGRCVYKNKRAPMYIGVEFDLRVLDVVGLTIDLGISRASWFPGEVV